MGEEGKKSEEEKSGEAPNPEKPAAEDGKKEDKKSEEPTAVAEAPPPSPPEIVLKVYMHCEGCARKVRRCLKGFEGVEDVITDCKAGKVVVRGEKADPVRVLKRIQRKSHLQVELISPIPKETVDKDVPKVEEKKVEPQVITVVLGVYMHCEACAQEIKKRILRMKGVESAEPDLKSSQVKVEGSIEPSKLVDYVHKRTGKHATIIEVEPEKPNEGKDEAKKPDEAKKGGEESKVAGESGGNEEEEEESRVELRKNELYYYNPQPNYQLYPQRLVQEYSVYPPQMFSEENPYACTLM